MALIVQKYGGTSVGSIERIQEVAKRIKRFYERDNQLIVVLSAMSGETNRLLDLAKAAYPKTYGNNQLRELDQIAATGEQVSIGLLTLTLHSMGLPAVSVNGYQAGINTSKAYSKARIDSINSKKLKQKIDQNKILIVAGFQGINQNNDLTTLGRGGSDTSAVAIAAAISADECQIYTDVNGVYTADPRIVSEAARLPEITFEEMMELASLGSKVLQIRAVEFAGKYKVKLRVLSSFTNDDLDRGTLITFEDKQMEAPIITGIAHSLEQAKISLQSVPDQPGIAYKILSGVANAGIDIDMIIQNSSVEGLTDFSFTVSRSDAKKSVEILTPIKEEIKATAILCDENMAKVSIVGIGMKSHSGIASKIFETLANENINVQMISTSEIKVSVVIDEKYTELALRSLHSAFNLSQVNGKIKS